VAFLPAYGFGLALVRSVVLYTRVRDSEVQVAELEREWSAARLAALRMQLSPHTLFNLLHTIRGNIEWDPRGAQAMVVQLADLLRRLLSAGERDFSRLADELQFAGMYLELQQRRFADRMRFTLPVGGEIPAVWVPSLILQPLIENAVVHGLAGHQGPIDISITAQATGDVLRLRVVNTMGPPRPAGAEGIGLHNVRERLAVQFGKRGSVRAGADAGAWSVDLTLPAIRAAPAARENLRLVGT
jgi:sensor histidine kinase YesM